jgi:hypothetical protein
MMPRWRECPEAAFYPLGLTILAANLCLGVTLDMRSWVCFAAYTPSFEEGCYET